MLTFPILPTEEVRSKQQDKYKFDIGFNNISQIDKDTLLNFFTDVSRDNFYYWSRDNYTVYSVSNYFTVQNTQFVIASSVSTGKDNIWVNDVINTTLANPATNPSSIVLSNVINAPITCFVEQQYYSGDVEYLHIYNSTVSVKIRQANSTTLVLSVRTPNKAYSKVIPLHKKEYDIYGVIYNYILYAVSVKSDRVVLGHNGSFVEIIFDTNYDVSNLEIVSTKNINNIIISNGFADGDLLKGFNQWIGNTLTISVYANSVSLSEYAPAYVNGSVRYIASFLNESIQAIQESNSTFSMSMSLIATY